MSPRPVSAVLVLLIGLALALAGVPSLFPPAQSRASSTVRGSVIDGRGYGVVDAAVFLFSEQHLELVEETRTDEDGQFGFQLAAARPRVFVRPPVESGLACAFGPSAPWPDAPQSLVLRPARLLELHVEDERGQPLAEAEVRAYEHRDEAAVVALGTTDATGCAHLRVPPEVDLAAFSPAPPHIGRWLFDASVPEGGAALTLRLPDARQLEGRVRDADGPLAGLVVVAWDETGAGNWDGFAVTDALGRFELPISAAATTVRALAPAATHLPGRLELAPGNRDPVELVLERGEELTVRTTRDGIPLVSRVWCWSPQTATWSWGMRTDASGHTKLRVARRFALHAAPLDPAYPPLEAWDVPFTESNLHLEADTDS